jgi:hypothetical protein
MQQVNNRDRYMLAGILQQTWRQAGSVRLAFRMEMKLVVRSSVFPHRISVPKASICGPIQPLPPTPS